MWMNCRIKRVSLKRKGLEGDYDIRRMTFLVVDCNIIRKYKCYYRRAFNKVSGDKKSGLIFDH